MKQMVNMKSLMVAMVLLSSLIVSNIAFSQRIVNHEFPRLATLNWGGGGNVNWLSRFDLILGVDSDSLLYRAVKVANPNGYILTTTDWNAGGPFRIWGNLDAIPPEWRVRHSDGSYIKVYSSDYFVDPTEYCGLYNGERYNQALPRRLMERTDWNIFDGVSSDGSWPFPYNTGGDIDLDRNGVNDYTEYSSSWIKTKWQAGQNAMRNNLRDRFNAKWGNPNEKMIFYWTITDTMCIRVVNGGGWENMYMNSPKTFSSWVPLINQWDSTGVAPRINVATADIVFDSVNAPDRHKDYYRFLRWTLTTAMLNNVYFMSGDVTDHHWSNYYDEYDIKLGHPKGRAQKLSNGCWVRFFDNGVSIVNPTNSTQTVSSSDLSSLSGYDGPYYRFKGNQDPVWNDGSLFTSVTLTTSKASFSGSTQYVGDGIILVKTPTTIVSDIIIDNSYSGTSPGSPSASLTGFSWDQDARSSSQNPLWFTNMALQYYDANYYKSYYASSGDGSAKAIYKPTIKISGKYKVYEWHGWRGKYASSYKEASNVPCTIVHSNGITSLTIDQLNNSGKWNLLGTFTFNAGDSASIVISNQADGYVISDAFKFEYVNEDGSAPSVPELSSPSNGAFNIVNPPTMSWNAVTGANKYQLQIATDSLFSNIVFTDSLITTLSKQITALTFNTTYFWKLRAENQFGVSNWSNVWHFTTVTSALSIPVLSFPDNGSINVHTPLNLIWDSVSSAVKYHLQIASDSGFTQKVVEDTSLTTISKQVNSLNYKKKYYWRVKAKNNVTSSEFSPAWQFTTQDVSTSLTMNSSYIDFGKVLIGTTRMDSVTLNNNGVDTMVISGIQVSSPQFLVNCSSLVIAPGAQEKMFIVFMATKKATFTANITFGYGPPLDFDTIRVSGRGIAPPRNLRNLAKITFVGVPLGTSAVDSFFIHNDGETDLVIDSMRTTSSTFEVNPVALTVAPNDSELVYVSASPMFYQSESAYIIFVDNSVKSPDSMVVELSELTDVREEAIPTEYSIKQNYPNPFNPTTTIRYSLPFSSNVTIKVFNIIGQEVITLIDGIESSGHKAAMWDGNDQNGHQVPSGTYLYRIEAKSTINQNSIYTAVKKMILMK